MTSENDIHSARILIIDDQMLYIRLLEQILRVDGYTYIYSTTNPREAIALYQDIRPDIVLLDLKMPKFDGFQIMKEFDELKSDVYLPLLVLSDDVSQEIRLRALKAGATDFLNKPYESVEVLVRVKNMIETRMLQRKVREQNIILEGEVKERTKELSTTRLDIIQRLARAAEYRDNDTGIHIVRMSKYCVALGAAAGMSEREYDLLLHASPLHDVGKIGIPDSILLKQSKLTDEEWEAMRTHTTIGAELLSGSNSELMKMAQQIALTHQEHWDGNGYPRGLKGEEIPLVGRICGLCDVFDALTMDRPYKAAWPVDKAVEEIKKESGKHFDPRLVECFMRILPQILEIKDKYAG